MDMNVGVCSRVSLKSQNIAQLLIATIVFEIPVDFCV